MSLFSVERGSKNGFQPGSQGRNSLLRAGSKYWGKILMDKNSSGVMFILYWFFRLCCTNIICIVIINYATFIDKIAFMYTRLNRKKKTCLVYYENFNEYFL